MYSQYTCKGEIEAEQKHDIQTKVKGLIMYKICGTSRNSLDSICLSSFLGLVITGIYSNYYTIFFAVSSFMSLITTSMVAGIGNNIVVKNREDNYLDMKRIDFVYMWITSVFLVCMMNIFQPFMELWLGKDLLFPFPVVVFFSIYFYTLKMGDVRAMYSDAIGLWWENRYRTFLEAICNIVLNVLLVKYIGVYGVILATVISLIVGFVMAGRVLFKNFFGIEKYKEYLFSHIIYMTVTLAVTLVSYAICNMVQGSAIFIIVIRLFICIVISNVLLRLFYGNLEIFKDVSELIKRLIYRG